MSKGFDYGREKETGERLILDRQKLHAPHGFILGGDDVTRNKFVMNEITQAFTDTDDDIIICDPYGEYTWLVQRLNGQVITLNPDSQQFINPLDISLNDLDCLGDDYKHLELQTKMEFVSVLCGLILGRENLNPVEQHVLNRCIKKIYEPFFANPQTAPMPLLQDLHTALLELPYEETKAIATALEPFIFGEYKMFNRHTTVDMSNCLVSFAVMTQDKHYDPLVKQVAMLTAFETSRQRLHKFITTAKRTRIYMNDCTYFYQHGNGMAYYFNYVWNRARPYGGIMTGIIENTKDLLTNRLFEAILANNSFNCVFPFFYNEIGHISELLRLSTKSAEFLTSAMDNDCKSDREGVICFGDKEIPFSF